jgi:hypothetical protein
MNPWLIGGPALFLALAAHAATIEGIVFPQQVTLEGRTLQLNGWGLRQYSVFKIDVYAAALYLRAAERDADKVLSSSEPRLIHMQFLRDVSREDSLKAWDHYFLQNCSGDCELPAAAIAAFRALVPEARAGDTQTYRFFADCAEIQANGHPPVRIDGAAFSRLLLSTWIGTAPTSTDLKRDLLGGKSGP